MPQTVNCNFPSHALKTDLHILYEMIFTFSPADYKTAELKSCQVLRVCRSYSLYIYNIIIDIGRYIYYWCLVPIVTLMLTAASCETK